MRVVRILGALEPGGAQLSALRLSVALRRFGVATTLLAGDATPPGLELAARYGLPADAYRVSEVLAPDSLQWTPAPRFADWLGPRLARAGLVHAHMVGAWWAAAGALPPRVPLVASEHNQLSWPGGDHTRQAREAARRVDMFFAHGPAARDWAARIGLDDGRLREGRSSVEGLSARPLPGLPSPRLTFAGRLRGEDQVVHAAPVTHDERLDPHSRAGAAVGRLHDAVGGRPAVDRRFTLLDGRSLGQPVEQAALQEREGPARPASVTVGVDEDTGPARGVA